MTPDRLAATWPTLLGRRVRLKSRIERAIGPSRVLVLAGGHRFLVNLSPERAWHGAQTHTFRVLGATRVSFHGKTVIVELTLDDDDTNQTNRTNQPNEEGG